VRLRLASPTLVVLLFAADARATGLATLELGAGLAQGNPSVPPSLFEYQRYSLRYDATRRVSLGGSIRVTHDFESSPEPGSALRTGSDWVIAATLTGSYDITPHLSLDATVSGSPPSARDVASDFIYPLDDGTTTSETALFHTVSSNAGAALDVTYDTYDEEVAHNVDFSVDASLGATHFASVQTMESLETGTGVSSIASLTANCSGPSEGFCPALARAAQRTAATLNQFRFGAVATATLKTRTDLIVDGNYYVYDAGAPGNAGFTTFGDASWGTGLPFIPPRFSLRGEVGQRLGPASVNIYYQFTDYALDNYVGHAVGGKVLWRFGDWRAYVNGGFRTDVGGDSPLRTWTAGLGVSRVL
jgi:hypothetical protein